MNPNDPKKSFMNEPQDKPAESMEVLVPSAVEALERAQVDIQIATAHKFPRSLDLFQKRAMSMATLDEETAESCIYSRPVGKDPDTGKQKFVEGASIRLAEIVAASYGNIRVASRLIEQTPTYVKAEGVAHDLESNYAGKSEVIESTVDRNGRPFSERMRIVVAKAVLAKAYRDAVFKVVPKALCRSVYLASLKVINGDGRTIEQRRAKAKEWLKSLKVDESRVFAALSVTGWSDIGERQLELLTGIKTAISDNDVSLDEAFPPLTTVEQSKVKKPETSAAATAAATAPATPVDDALIDLGKPFDSILAVAKRDGVSEGAVLEYAKKHKLAGAQVPDLMGMAEGKVVQLLQAWPEVVKQIKG